MTERKVGTFEQALGSIGRAFDEFMPVFRKIMAQAAIEAKPPEPYERYQMRKWLSQVPHGGIVDDKAVLIVYNKEYPERSEILVEGI